MRGSSSFDFTYCPRSSLRNSIPPPFTGTGISEPSGEPRPTVKVWKRSLHARAAVTASASSSSPSEKMISARCSLSPLPNASSAARIASERFVPPRGMMSVSISCSDSRTALKSDVSGACKNDDPANASSPTRSPSIWFNKSSAASFARVSRFGWRSVASIEFEVSIAMITSRPLCRFCSHENPHCGRASATSESATPATNSAKPARLRAMLTLPASRGCRRAAMSRSSAVRRIFSA